MTDSTYISNDDLDELRRVEEKGLWLNPDNGEYTVYWTDGDRFITHNTHKGNKAEAERVLKNLLLDYWMERDDSKKMCAIVHAIRTATKVELAEISSHVEDEMEIRGMKRRDLGWRYRRRQVRRAKDYLWSYYSRQDYDTDGKAI